MTTKLSNDGYKIIKNNYDTKIIKEIKDELTVKPYTYNKSQNNDSGKSKNRKKHNHKYVFNLY